MICVHTVPRLLTHFLSDSDARAESGVDLGAVIASISKYGSAYTIEGAYVRNSWRIE